MSTPVDNKLPASHLLSTVDDLAAPEQHFKETDLSGMNFEAAPHQVPEMVNRPGRRMAR